MKESKHKYYLVEGGRVLKAIETFCKELREGVDRRAAFQAEYKADGIYANSYSVLGLEFIKRKPPDGWRVLKKASASTYYPNRRTKAGRAIYDKMENLSLPTVERFSKLSGIGFWPIIYCGKPFLAFPSFEVIGDKFVLEITIGDKKPEKPLIIPAGCLEIPTSEYWKLKEDAENVQ